MADAWGIEPGWWDVGGTWHDTPRPTARALRVAMGGLADVDDPPPATRPVWFVRAGTAPSIERPAELELEDGTRVGAAGSLPPDLPLGYHDLHPSDGGPTTRLVVVPPRCSAAPDRAAGLAVQLYAARSRSSWGIGDLADLATTARLGREAGAPFVLCSPLHAPLPVARQEPSPYFASSRCWRSPLHLRLEEVPGWNGDDDRLRELADAGRALGDRRAIDRDAVWALKREALARIWRATRERIRDDRSFQRFRATEGTDLEGYATFCALAEHHGEGWRSWPAEHRRPDGSGVARFADDHADALAFHAWVQWLLDTQTAAAGGADGGGPLIFDLAVGADPDGADCWLWQDVLAAGARVGAPPDDFNGDGQDWGFPPFVPWRLRAVGYAPLATLLRSAFRHAAGLRIDHVMGLFRLFWMPEGSSPAEGGYVRYAGTELLDVVALESVRAGAFVVGEDLGTVEDEVRTALADRDVLSYRLVWFEERPPSEWPVDALGAVTTHDLPTVAGAWTGADDPEGRFGDRLAALTGLGRDAAAGDVAVAAHRELAATPCRLAVATLEDLAGAVERPNVPGTTTERANWSLALPVPIDDLPASTLATDVLDAVTSSNRSW